MAQTRHGICGFIEAMDPDARPTVRQIYALAAALCDRAGEEWPESRGAASELIERVRIESGHPAPRLEDSPWRPGGLPAGARDRKARGRDRAAPGRGDAVTPAEAMRLAVELDLDLDDLSICLACLSEVSMAIDGGNEHAIRGATIRMTRDLWAEGLEQPARSALEGARDHDLPGAEAALAEVAELGPRSRIARAIVRVLAEQLSERAGGDLLKMGFEPWPPEPDRWGSPS